MKILFVVSRFPYPLIQGDRVRGYHFLRLMNKRHRIILMTPMARPVDSQAQQVVTQLCDSWVPVHIPQWQSIAHLSRFPFSALPLQTLYFCPPAIQKRVQTLFQAESFDLVHVQLARMAPVVDGLDGVPKVLDFIDALSLNMYRRAMQERWPLNWLFHQEAQRMARYERALLRSFDRQTVSSHLDKEAIGACESLHVIPNGVNTEEFLYTEDSRDNKVIVFTGRMSYFPNTDAAIYFASQVFPLILRQEPDAHFLIVGTDPSWLEAMATGAPVVATPYALGGVEATDGEHLLVAGDAKGLADQVLRLFKDAALRQRLARNARRLVEAEYTWERSVAMLEEVYRLAV
jgi:glycosyltransferase involved in cell wall biosynthesis